MACGKERSVNGGWDLDREIGTES
ncbi:hypothetical protein CCACVL1_28774 [Corchorus capsularis]|uniref:Uncharacterized protein n=1 Tax=Corchorus capsularis TaxID=210143 RepID=A0A1R3G596_COCAP|nr:hypothetical protein CCACVL1_28774 [Corchorus capsularis]